LFVISLANACHAVSATASAFKQLLYMRGRTSNGAACRTAAAGSSQVWGSMCRPLLLRTLLLLGEHCAAAAAGGGGVLLLLQWQDAAPAKHTLLLAACHMPPPLLVLLLLWMWRTAAFASFTAMHSPTPHAVLTAASNCSPSAAGGLLLPSC
jgi:hypothetical protein